MKKTASILLALIVITSSLSACKNKERNSKIETVTVAELTRDIEFLKNNINAYKNLAANDEMVILIPEIESVYTFITELSEKKDFNTKYTQFCQLFEALHGDYKMNEDYIFYTGGYSDSYTDFTDYPIVKDNFEKLSSGDENCNGMFYDETWYRDMTDWTSPVSLGVGQTMEYDTVTFNKGKAVYLGGKINGIYPCLDYYSPYDSFGCIGTYPPDSTEAFKLSDKEISICDAVAFYENYINSLPYPSELLIQMKVREVDVLTIPENKYGYAFTVSQEYCGLAFDYSRNESYIPYKGYEYYDSILLTGFMIESDSVDIGAALYDTKITEKTEIGVVPVETAIEKVSTELSDYVEFEVNSIELVYSRMPERTSEGYFDIETPSSSVAPAWKLTLYNSNDRLYYCCYVDAADCENFRYYTTDGK